MDESCCASADDGAAVVWAGIVKTERDAFSLC
jgi:hypothetical protein